MYTKLTLNIDQKIAESARIYAKSAKRSISQLVEGYLLLISQKAIKNETITNRPLGPITKQITDIIKANDNLNHKELLAEALTEKYL